MKCELRGVTNPDDQENKRALEPRKDPSSDPDWRSDPFWDPQWQPEDPPPSGFFSSLAFLVLSLLGTLSGAATVMLLTLLGLLWIGSTVVVLLSFLSPTGSLAGSETLVGLTALSWLLAWAWYKRTRK